MPYHRRVRSLGIVCIVLGLALAAAAAAGAATVRFQWLPNSEDNLAGYKIYYGTASRNYTASQDQGLPPTQQDGYVHGQVDGLDPGATYYFAATAYNSDGAESAYSEEVVYTVPLGPRPQASDAQYTVSEDQTLSGQLAATGEAGPLTYAVAQNPSHGTVTLAAQTGAFTYTPSADFTGADSFTFTATDGNGTSDPATVSITVQPVNDAPVAINGALTVQGGAAASGQLTATDVDTPASSLSYALVGQPAHGQVALQAGGQFTYSADQDYTGTDSFTFRVSDGSLWSDTATVAITVESPYIRHEIMGDATNSDYPGTIEDTFTNINASNYSQQTTMSVWSWSSPSPHKPANTIVSPPP